MGLRTAPDEGGQEASQKVAQVIVEMATGRGNNGEGETCLKGTGCRLAKNKASRVEPGRFDIYAFCRRENPPMNQFSLRWRRRLRRLFGGSRAPRLLRR